MPQPDKFPIADVAAGGWSPSAGSTLWEVLDDITDSTLISTTGTGTAQLTLNTMKKPHYGYKAVGSQTEHACYIEWRADYSGITSTNTARVLLYEGATLRHTGTTRTLNRTSPTTYTENLSSATMNAIDDWENLELRIEAVAGSFTKQVYWARFIIEHPWVNLWPINQVGALNGWLTWDSKTADIWQQIRRDQYYTDSTYIKNTSINSTYSVDIQLTPTKDPANLALATANEGHIMHYRVWRNSTNSTIRIDLYQGGTLIQTGITRSPSTSTWTTYSDILTTTEANNITDFKDLRARISHINSSGGLGNEVRVSFCTLYMPLAGKPIF